MCCRLRLSLRRSLCPLLAPSRPARSGAVTAASDQSRRLARRTRSNDQPCFIGTWRYRCSLSAYSQTVGLRALCKAQKSGIRFGPVPNIDHVKLCGDRRGTFHRFDRALDDPFVVRMRLAVIVLKIVLESRTAPIGSQRCRGATARNRSQATCSRTRHAPRSFPILVVVTHTRKGKSQGSAAYPMAPYEDVSRTGVSKSAGRLGWKVRSSWVIWSAEIGLEK